MRSGYQQTRTARINAVRGHLREFGIVIPTGASRVVPMARAALEDEGVPAYLLDVLDEVLDEIETLSEKAKAVQRRLERLSEQMPEAQRESPGVCGVTRDRSSGGFLHRKNPDP